MKTKEELNALKEEVETLNAKLAELTEDELAQVAGGGSLETFRKGDWVLSYSIPEDNNRTYQISEVNWKEATLQEYIHNPNEGGYYRGSTYTAFTLNCRHVAKPVWF